jgi:hypothetical protein
MTRIAWGGYYQDWVERLAHAAGAEAARAAI